MHLADLTSYIEAQERLGELYADPEAWARKAILNIAGSGQILQRPHHRRIRSGDLEGAAMPSVVRNACPRKGTHPRQFLRWRADRRRRRCWSISRGSSGSTTSGGPTWTIPTRWSASAPADIAARRCAARLPRRTSWPSRRPSATTAQPGHRRSALHGQGHPRAVRAGAAHRARGAGGQRRGDRHPARRRRDADAGHLAGHPRLQSRPQGRISRTASSSRRRTTRPRTAASSTTRRTAARPTLT